MFFDDGLFFKIVLALLFISGILAILPYSFWVMLISNDNEEKK